MKQYAVFLYYNAENVMIMYFIPKISEENTGEYLEKTLTSVESLLGISITVHDRHGLLRDKNGESLLPGRHLHCHPYCVSGRYTYNEWGKNCYRDCFSNVEPLSARELRPFVKNCWKGVSELVVPIARAETHMLTLFGGLFRHEENYPNELKNHKELTEMYAAIPPMDTVKLDEYYRILLFTGHGIVHYMNDRHGLNPPSASRKDQIQSYIHYNVHRGDFKLGDLARHLNLSPSRASHLVTTYFGSSFSDLVMRERMLRARVLLTSSENTLEDVCDAIGLNDVYYFNKTFKRFFGLPPGRFRRTRAEKIETSTKYTK
eukprot:TRINITY_DN6371_c0_g2_i3.p1 TRINITY_DN6371_c0_g2~~TRINITY_DN6371_c0_g2_i3.p1  ORF type:complete len:317 (+),score=40.92 TRINITY_DN6371_c0_g2_i3:255-1205(+)